MHHIQEFSELHVMAKNLKSIRNGNKLQDFIAELDSCDFCDFDILLVSETWRDRREEAIITAAGHKVFLSGGSCCKNGVGICVSRRLLDGTGEPTSYHQILSRSLQTPPEDLNSLESACKYAVSKTSRTCTANTLQQQFHDDYFQSLLAERRATACRHRRAEISKTIRKKFGENFVDKELNALNPCWRNLLH